MSWDNPAKQSEFPMRSMYEELITITHALSLTQPWATLCALGAKQHETRCWPTRYRGWIAIHAAKGFPRDCQELCGTEPFRKALREIGGYGNTKELPRGQVIAVAELIQCTATTEWAPPEDSDEFAFGDYSFYDGGNGKARYSFKLKGVRRLREPFDAKGSLGIWRLPQPITAADLV